ncbi:MAG TPA: NAD-dependent 4,6-dehydratase LegB [Candidatus Eremiobacteraeota bacterium]|nr:NAD-dependent 4,6-dehydratase LegB [Candidatus Eremiobacteraeota bacterium]
MKVALVTGAGGFIGSHLCEKLIEDKYRVKAFIRYNSRNSWGWLEHTTYKKDIEIIAGDIRNYDSVKNAIKNVDTVFHLAALIGIPYSYQSPDSYIDTNIKGTMNILQAAREEGVKKIIHTSTSEIYGTAQFVPITENHPVHPQSPYAATKAGADFLALSFYRSFNLPVAVIRPFNTYGPRQSARAVIPTIITQILDGRKKIKLGSLHPTRDLTYVKDTVRGFIEIGESEKTTGEIINIASNSEISILELVNLIAGIMEVKIEIEREKERERPENSEVARLFADTQKARQLLKWIPQYSLKDGLKETIEWFKDHKNLYKVDMYNV